MEIMEIIALITLLGVGGGFVYLAHDAVRQDKKRERARERK